MFDPDSRKGNITYLQIQNRTFCKSEISIPKFEIIISRLHEQYTRQYFELRRFQDILF